MSRKDEYEYIESKKFPGVKYFGRRQSWHQRYAWLYQGKGINVLSTINQAMIDDAIENGRRGIEKDGVSILFSPEMSTKETFLGDRTVQVLFYIIQIFAGNLKKLHGGIYKELRFIPDEDIMRSRYVDIKISDVANLFKMTTHGARKMLNRAIDVLYELSLKWKEDKKCTHFGEDIYANAKFRFRLLTRVNEYNIYSGDNKKLRSGYIRVALEPDFARYLPTANGTWFPIALYEIAPSRHPGAFGIGLKMTVHYRMNRHKKNRNVLSVESLLNVATDIPSYDVIKNKGEISRRIIRPFVRALETLEEKNVLKKWEFIVPNTNIVVPVDYVLNKITYDEIKMINVHFSLLEYPRIGQKKEVLPAVLDD